MDRIFAKVTSKIYGNSNCWSIESNQEAIAVTETEIELAIQGTKKHGYNLVMSPQGFFTADYWYPSKEEAIEEAEELFGIESSEWSSKKSTEKS